MGFVLSLSFVVVLAAQLNTRISTRMGNAGREPESFTDIARKLPVPGVIVTRLSWPPAASPGTQSTVIAMTATTLTEMARNLRLGWHLQ
jgi:hypothetical protein